MAADQSLVRPDKVSLRPTAASNMSAVRINVAMRHRATPAETTTLRLDDKRSERQNCRTKAAHKPNAIIAQLARDCENTVSIANIASVDQRIALSAKERG